MIDNVFIDLAKKGSRLLPFFVFKFTGKGKFDQHYIKPINTH